MANRIEELREARGVSISELARRVKTTPGQIQKLERGQRRLSLEWMQRISNALGVRTSALLPVEDGLLAGEEGFLNAVLTLFPKDERGAAEEMAAGFLRLVLEFRSRTGMHVTNAQNVKVSDEQRVMARSLIKLSRHMAEAMSGSRSVGRRSKR